MITHDDKRKSKSASKFSYEQWLADKVRIEKERELAKLKKPVEEDDSNSKKYITNENISKFLIILFLH